MIRKGSIHFVISGWELEAWYHVNEDCIWLQTQAKLDPKIKEWVVVTAAFSNWWRIFVIICICSTKRNQQKNHIILQRIESFSEYVSLKENHHLANSSTLLTWQEEVGSWRQLQKLSSSLGKDVGKGWSGMIPTYIQVQVVSKGKRELGTDEDPLQLASKLQSPVLQSWLSILVWTQLKEGAFCFFFQFFFLLIVAVNSKWTATIERLDFTVLTSLQRIYVS